MTVFFTAQVIGMAPMPQTQGTESRVFSCITQD